MHDDQKGWVSKFAEIFFRGLEWSLIVAALNYAARATDRWEVWTISLSAWLVLAMWLGDTTARLFLKRERVEGWAGTNNYFLRGVLMVATAALLFSMTFGINHIVRVTIDSVVP